MIQAHHLRQAIEDCLAMPDWYDQGSWGRDCQSPRCVWGQACLLAGVRPGPPAETGHDAGRYGDVIAAMARCPSAGILRIMAAVQEDGSIPQEILTEVVSSHDHDDDVKYEAVIRMTEQSALAGIALSEQSAVLRQAAVRRLRDQQALYVVATGDPHPFIRLEAVRLLTDQAALERIAREGDDDARREAAGLLTDQAVLADIAQHDPEWSVRVAAVIRLTDKTVLVKIASADHSIDVRAAAGNRLIRLDKEIP